MRLQGKNPLQDIFLISIVKNTRIIANAQVQSHKHQGMNDIKNMSIQF